MTGSVILDIVIGLVFVYLLYSLFATILQEIVATKFSFRAKMLEKAIVRMLEDGKSTKRWYFERLYGLWLLFTRSKISGKPGMRIAGAFYSHPLIKYLAENNRYSKPDYISPGNFSKVIFDLLKGPETISANAYESLKDSVENGFIKIISVIPDANAPEAGKPRALHTHYRVDEVHFNVATSLFLRSLWRDSNADLDQFKTRLEQWFTDTMDRANGWYKRYVQYLLTIVGFIIAVSFNVDTLQITDKLSRDPKLREQMIQAAANFAEQRQTLITAEKPGLNDSAVNDLERKSVELNNAAEVLLKTDIENTSSLLALGWGEKIWIWESGFPWAAWFRSILGWLLTALAISLGAPFWFDLLNKLMQLRGAGKKPASDGGDNPDDAGSTTSKGNHIQSIRVVEKVG